MCLIMKHVSGRFKIIHQHEPSTLQTHDPLTHADFTISSRLAVASCEVFKSLVGYLEFVVSSSCVSDVHKGL